MGSAVDQSSSRKVAEEIAEDLQLADFGAVGQFVATGYAPMLGGFQSKMWKLRGPESAEVKLYHRPEDIGVMLNEERHCRPQRAPKRAMR